MVRILQVIGSLNNGGSQAMIMSLYRNIDRSKIQFDFIIDRVDEIFYVDEITSLGGKIYIIPTFNFKNLFRFGKHWDKFFKDHPEYKIIHGHVRSTASIYLRIAKKNGLRTIAHSHSTSSGKGLSALIKDILQYPIRYIADYFLACSKSSGIWLFGERACSKDKFFILNNAIDVKKFIYDINIRLEKRKEFQIEDKFVIGHVGRFNLPKNHKFLIDVFKEVHSRNNNAVLMLVGDGELRQLIEKKINNLGLTDSVIFTGVRSDIPKLLQAMDVFVFPSLFEGLGIVAVEAQAAGLQCVVADTIPKEAFITSLIEQVPLKLAVNFWAEKILQYADGYGRSNTYEQIKVHGYDIRETANWLELFYLERCKR